MADFSDKATIFKLVCMILAIVCYGIEFGYLRAILATPEQVIITSILAGFMIVYITICVGVLVGRDVETDLAAVWALYATCAYVVAGVLLIIVYERTTDSDDGKMGLATGALAVITAVMTACDCYFTING